MKKYVVLLLTISYLLPVRAQLSVTSGLTPAQYVDFLVGAGISYSNVTFSGDPNSIGRFTTGATPTNLGVTNGIIMSSGVVNGFGGQPLIGSPVGNFVSSMNSGGTDANLQALIPSYTVDDVTKIEFDFIPVSDTVKFRYVFGSEEYNEWVGSSFNDVFGFFISGPNPAGGNYSSYNIARIPGTTTPVSINNVNSGSYPTYYVNNEALGGTTIVYDGFTTVLTAWALVTPCVQYHIKLAIGDAGDQSYDSGVFLQENSFSSPVLNVNTQYVNDTILGNFAMEAGCNDVVVSFTLSQPTLTPYVILYNVSGSATPGTDYPALSGSSTIPAGSDSTAFTISPFYDGIPEGVEDIILVFQNTIGCSSTSDTLVIMVVDYEPMQPITSADTTICGDSAKIFSIGSYGVPPYNYVWDNGLPPSVYEHYVSPTANTTYTVTITDYCGYDAIEQINVLVGSDFADAGPDLTICQGEIATLTANPAQTYLWSTGDNDQSIAVSPQQSTIYYVTVTNLCTGTDSVNVYVNPLPIVAASLSPSTICAGEEVVISASGAENYFWEASPNDPSLTNQPGDPNESLTVHPMTNTTYTVLGSDANGCTGSAQTSVLVSPIPVASYIARPAIASTFDPVIQFFDYSIGNPIWWYWELGDGSTYSTNEFTHTFPADTAGEYTVMLVVMNSFGCVDTVFGSVLIKPDYTLYIPSAFTPNDDGINDYYHISGLNLTDEDFEFLIYDRWGHIVFQSSVPSKEWDGTVNGKYAPTGTYTYRLLFTDTDGNHQTRFGCISLFY